MQSVTEFLRRLFCRHEWQQCGHVIEGATLGWNLKPTRQYGYRYKCERCGKEQYQGGFVIPNDHILSPSSYNERGWPIDEDGKELPMVR